MADIFISYSSKDRESIDSLSCSLEARGPTVWYDRGLTAGDDLKAKIDHELNASEAVIVVWSPDSVKSDWVKWEARYAIESKKYLPVTLREPSIAEIGSPYFDYKATDYDDKKALSGGLYSLGIRFIGPIGTSERLLPKDAPVRFEQDFHILSVDEVRNRASKYSDGAGDQKNFDDWLNSVRFALSYSACIGDWLQVSNLIDDLDPLLPMLKMQEALFDLSMNYLDHRHQHDRLLEMIEKLPSTKADYASRAIRFACNLTNAAIQCETSREKFKQFSSLIISSFEHTEEIEGLDERALSDVQTLLITLRRV